MEKQLSLKTKVKGNYRAVIERFDRDLFEALIPKQGQLEIVEFTGSKTGDKVHLRFHSPIKADWISHITDDGINEKEAWFVDEGVQLPPGLTYWRHRHIVRKVDEHTSEIVDDITYKSWEAMTTWLAYPVLWLAFSPRKKIYQTYFGT